MKSVCLALEDTNRHLKIIEINEKLHENAIVLYFH